MKKDELNVRDYRRLDLISGVAKKNKKKLWLMGYIRTSFP